MKKTNTDTTHVCAHVDPAKDRLNVCEPCEHPLAARPIKATVLRGVHPRTGKLHERTTVLLRKSTRANRTQFSLLG